MLRTLLDFLRRGALAIAEAVVRAGGGSQQTATRLTSRYGSQSNPDPLVTDQLTALARAGVKIGGRITRGQNPPLSSYPINPAQPPEEPVVYGVIVEIPALPGATDRAQKRGRTRVDVIAPRGLSREELWEWARQSIAANQPETTSDMIVRAVYDADPQAVKFVGVASAYRAPNP